MYDIKEIESFLSNENIYNELIDYCKLLSIRYNETNEGLYRIKYNDLYPILFLNLTDEKKVEFFNSFSSSLENYPIVKITKNKIKLASI